MNKKKEEKKDNSSSNNNYKSVSWEVVFLDYTLYFTFYSFFFTRFHPPAYLELRRWFGNPLLYVNEFTDLIQGIWYGYWGEGNEVNNLIFFWVYENDDRNWLLCKIRRARPFLQADGYFHFFLNGMGRTVDGMCTCLRSLDFVERWEREAKVWRLFMDRYS